MAKESTGATIRRTAAEVKRYRRIMKIVPIGILLALLVVIIGYVLSVLYMRFGAFTVMVNKFGSDYALSLSESKDFLASTSHLSAEIDERITNIDGKTLPEWLDNVDGVHNGENYIAYTFYCKNVGRSTLDYSYKVYIANMSLDIEKAVRIRLYVDGEYVDYAYPRTDGISGPEPGTTSFASATTVVEKTIRDFEPGDITKYTVVIWLEGPDPDCIDKILGGQMKVDMVMNVLSKSDSTSESTQTE